MRHLKRQIPLILAAACLAFVPQWSARAEQSALLLPAGGLNFAPVQGIDFEEEVLVLSASEVRASYRLRNITDADKTILVTLPLPDVPMADLHGRSNDLASSGEVNFTAFEAYVDSKEADVTFERLAVALGLDVTQMLRNEGLPLGPDMSQMAERIAALDPATRAFMVEQGILQIEDARLKPAWTLKTTFFWRQLLPAGVPVTIDISYVPVAGHNAYSPQRLARLKSTYCVNDPTAEEVANRAARGGGAPVMTQIIHLSTQGAHWHKPTGKFRLVIDTADPSVVLATCMKGFKPLSATRVEWSTTDFLPDDDIKVLFVR